MYFGAIIILLFQIPAGGKGLMWRASTALPLCTPGPSCGSSSRESWSREGRMGQDSELQSSIWSGLGGLSIWGWRCPGENRSSTEAGCWLEEHPRRGGDYRRGRNWSWVRGVVEVGEWSTVRIAIQLVLEQGGIWAQAPGPERAPGGQHTQGDCWGGGPCYNDYFSWVGG